MRTALPHSTQPFNSPFETGLRSLFILNSDLEITLDLQQLVAFDYLVVHTGDFQNGPSSLHPENINRNGELLIRRELVQRGLNIMEGKKLISKNTTSSGFTYSSTETAAVVLDLFTSSYLIELKHRSKWVVDKYKKLGEEAFPFVFNSAFERWTTEFQLPNISISEYDK